MKLDKSLTCLSRAFLVVSHRNQLELGFAKESKRVGQGGSRDVLLNTVRLASRLRKALNLDQERAGSLANTPLIHPSGQLQNGFFLLASLSRTMAAPELLKSSIPGPAAC